MKGMIETKRVGGRGIDVQPIETNDMQSQKEELSCDMQSGRVQDISLMHTYKL